jgi:hypothetical protein
MRPLKASLLALSLASSALLVACGGDDAVVGDDDSGSDDTGGFDTRPRDTGVKVDAPDTSTTIDTAVSPDTNEAGTDTADAGGDTLVADTRDGAVADTADATTTTDTADAGATDTADAGGTDATAADTADAGSDVVTTDVLSDGDAATACHVVINEVKVAGTAIAADSGTDAGGATASADEFIEIYNPCGTTIDLAGYVLAYRSASNNKDALPGNDSNALYTWVLVGSPDAGDAALASTTLAPGAFFVVGSPATTYTGPKDAVMTCGFAFTTGCLAGAGGSLAIRDASGAILDAVFYGAYTGGTGGPLFIEGTATTAPAANSSTGRHPDGHDTNNNVTDFTTMTTPTPKATNP